MAANEELNQLSTTDASNTPAGSDVIGSSLDDELRSIKANIARSAREESTATASAAATLAVTVLNKIVPVSGSAGGSTTITLPAAATAGAGFRFTAWKTDNTNNVIIDANGAETINGAANYTLATQYEAAQFVTDGTSWVVEGAAKRELGTSDLADDSVTNAKLANMAQDRIKGRVTAGTGDPEDLTASQVRTMLGVITGSGSNDRVAVWTGSSDLDFDDNFTWNGTTLDVDGAVTINETGASVDFRVESVNNANMLFVDGVNDKVLVGGSSVTSQDAPLQVTGNGSNQITIKSNGGGGYTQGGIVIEGSTSTDNSPGNRGQGIYYFNEANDRTYYSGTLYNNGTVWGIGSTTGTSLAVAAADNANALFTVDSSGNVAIDGALSKGSGSFKIDHPLSAKSDTHHLVHSFVEGPQADLIYRGKADLIDGSAVVNIDIAAGMTDGTFVALCTDVQCFTSNESGWTAVKGVVSGNTLTITAQDNTCTDTISWMVVGERKDAHMVAADWTDDNGKVIVEPLKSVVN